VIGTEGVDIEASAASVTRVNRKLFWFTLPLDIAKNGFNTMFMKLTQLSEADEVAKQALF
jgi:hypothetical protein